MRKVSFVVVGAGCRGSGYTKYIQSSPDEGEVIAVCEPIDEVRNRFGDTYNIPEELRFHDWKDILDKPKLAEAALICTQDAQHRDPAVALAGMGYHLMLEKPMAPTPEDCKVIYDAVIKNGVMLAVCHVLRYTALNIKLKEIIDSGVIGDIRDIQLIEQVGFWHQAHSYVRGNWRNEKESSSMLLAKSCHDMDILNYFIPSKCKSVSSFGSLSYFTRENQPKGAADRCTDCPRDIESKCPYSALKIYIRDRINSLDEWPVNVLTHEATEEAVMRELENGPYGRCVFACDNDVVDHQVVNLEFEGGATASFTMSAFNFAAGREVFIMGDQGALKCTETGIDHYDFLSGKKSAIPLDTGDGLITSGHGGGDFGLMGNFLNAVRNNDPSYITSGPDVSLESHLIVFAAEKARRDNTVEHL
ncbi:MAG: Gfo/Idh/MocA family oxidoreductase [Armatimonadota bacterium]|nr:Gfo/Idh/MocA family oxidoreductase [bacterium]